MSRATSMAQVPEHSGELSQPPSPLGAAVGRAPRRGRVHSSVAPTARKTGTYYETLSLSSAGLGARPVGHHRRVLRPLGRSPARHRAAVHNGAARGRLRRRDPRRAARRAPRGPRSRRRCGGPRRRIQGGPMNATATLARIERMNYAFGVLIVVVGAFFGDKAFVGGLMVGVAIASSTSRSCACWARAWQVGGQRWLADQGAPAPAQDRGPHGRGRARARVPAHLAGRLRDRLLRHPRVHHGRSGADDAPPGRARRHAARESTNPDELHHG